MLSEHIERQKCLYLIPLDTFKGEVKSRSTCREEDAILFKYREIMAHIIREALILLHLVVHMKSDRN